MEFRVQQSLETRVLNVDLERLLQALGHLVFPLLLFALLLGLEDLLLVEVLLLCVVDLAGQKELQLIALLCVDQLRLLLFGFGLGLF